ncbi:MAG: nickel pincer cofactor biosynthesis protein LarC [Nitrospirales bacterium]
MSHLHIDGFSGISGDMCLGTFVDIGVPLSVLKKGLKSLKADGFQLKAKKVHRGTIHATKVDVLIRRGFEKPLSLPTIRRIIKQSLVPAKVKTRSLDVFQRLAEAEGTVHGLPQTKVHFHEIGVIDSLVDIVGTFLAIHHLDIHTFSASPINVGAGTVQTAHGLLPVPGPAVAQLALGVPIFSSGPEIELTTPTGMGIVTALTQDFRSLPPLHPLRIGYGAGTANPSGWPNILRMFLGKDSSSCVQPPNSILEIHTTLDDLNPQAYESVMERLFAAGALDVTMTPVIMKRSRPGIILTVLAETNIREAIIRILFLDTTTLGLRIQTMSRQVLPRRMDSVTLPNGVVQIKIADLGNGQQKMMPEYRDCEAIAKKTGTPVRDVIQCALQTYQSQSRPKKKSPKV